MTVPAAQGLSLVTQYGGAEQWLGIEADEAGDQVEIGKCGGAYVGHFEPVASCALRVPFASDLSRSGKRGGVPCPRRRH